MKKLIPKVRKVVQSTTTLQESKPSKNIEDSPKSATISTPRAIASNQKKSNNKTIINSLKQPTSMKREMKENYTLTVYEQNVLLPIIVDALKTKKGKENAVTSTQIVQALRSHGLKLSERNVFKIVNHIRMCDLIVGLMGSSTGYYIINSEHEFIKYECTLLSREEALKQVRQCIERQRKSMFSKLSQKHSQLF